MGIIVHFLRADLQPFSHIISGVPIGRKFPQCFAVVLFWFFDAWRSSSVEMISNLVLPL